MQSYSVFFQVSANHLWKPTLLPQPSLPPPAASTIAVVSAEQVALIPECAECYRVWLPDDGDRWRAYLDTDDELVFYCPGCAERKFDD